MPTCDLVQSGKPRICGFCESHAAIIENTEITLRYECPDCGAIETITKTRPVPGKLGAFYPGWYHGWKRPDGAKLRSPTVGEMNRGDFNWQPD